MSLIFLHLQKNLSTLEQFKNSKWIDSGFSSKYFSNKRLIHWVPTNFPIFSMNGHWLNLQWATQHRFWVVNTFWIFSMFFWYWITHNFYVIHSLIFPFVSCLPFLLFYVRNIYETINIVLWFPLVQKSLLFMQWQHQTFTIMGNRSHTKIGNSFWLLFSPLRVSNS